MLSRCIYDRCLITARPNRKRAKQVRRVMVKPRRIFPRTRYQATQKEEKRGSFDCVRRAIEAFRACICPWSRVRTRAIVPHTGKKYPMTDFIHAARKKILLVRIDINRAYPIENKDPRRHTLTWRETGMNYELIREWPCRGPFSRDSYPLSTRIIFLHV